MHPRTKATLSELEQSDWFASVGVKDTKAAIVLGSWKQAIKHCASVSWQDLCLMAHNHLMARVSEKSVKRARKWNSIVRALKKHTMPLVRRKTEAVTKAHRLPRVFEDMVQWDILGVCIEAEYADLVPPAWSASQAYWYVKGHFPCGWKGNFPKGKLISY